VATEIIVALIGAMSAACVALIERERRQNKSRWEDNKQDHNFVVSKIEDLGKSLGRSIDRVESTALRTETKLDQHINDHATGNFSTRKQGK
jgi:hypothetical protein